MKERKFELGFVNIKIAKLYLELGRNLSKLSISQLVRMSFRNGSNITYTHAFKMLKSWEELGLVKIERVGRECFPSLTEKGRRVFSLLLNLLREVKEVEVGKKKKSEGVEENTNF